MIWQLEVSQREVDVETEGLLIVSFILRGPKIKVQFKILHM